MLTQQIYVHEMCVILFFKLTMKITAICHTILTFAVLCSLLSDLCIDLPIATIGRTGLCVLQIGGGRCAYNRGIDDHSVKYLLPIAYVNLKVFVFFGNPT